MYTMRRFGESLGRWGASALLMVVIFGLSSRTSDELPRFGVVDALIKKSGHVLGYGLLALSYWRGFGWDLSKMPHAWGLAVAYAATDELHQAFVPGRHPSVVDVLLFDAVGAALALWLRRWRAGSSRIPRLQSR
jgi:VanZ family protein